MLAGTGWLAVLSRRKAGVLAAIEIDLEATVDAHDSTYKNLVPANLSQPDLQQGTQRSAEGVADLAI
jgi:hypothetical protein